MTPIIPPLLDCACGITATGIAAGGTYALGIAAGGAYALGIAATGCTGGAAGGGTAAIGVAAGLTVTSLPHFTQKRSVASICAPQFPQNAISFRSPYCK
jgi:hypothetical protein